MVSVRDIEEAAERIGTRVRRTPVMEHAGVILKLELLQHAGSFKPRGAFNRVLSEETLQNLLRLNEFFSTGRAYARAAARHAR